MNIIGNDLWIRDHQKQIMDEARRLHKINNLKNISNIQILKNRLRIYLKNSLLAKYDGKKQKPLTI
jgi:hypothetical protein